MKASRWSLGDKVLVVVVVWLATIFLGSVAWNRGWKLPFGFSVPELVLLSLAIFYFRPSRWGRDD
jgi:hypothetical protein